MDGSNLSDKFTEVANASITEEVESTGDKALKRVFIMLLILVTHALLFISFYRCAMSVRARPAPEQNQNPCTSESSDIEEPPAIPRPGTAYVIWEWMSPYSAAIGSCRSSASDTLRLHNMETPTSIGFFEDLPVRNVDDED